MKKFILYFVIPAILLVGSLVINLIIFQKPILQSHNRRLAIEQTRLRAYQKLLIDKLEIVSRETREIKSSTGKNIEELYTSHNLVYRPVSCFIPRLKEATTSKKVLQIDAEICTEIHKLLIIKNSETAEGVFTALMKPMVEAASRIEKYTWEDVPEDIKEMLRSAGMTL